MTPTYDTPQRKISDSQDVSGRSMESGANIEQAPESLARVYRCPDCGSLMIAVPALACAKCGREHALRAYSYRLRSGKYIAECIDLDLITQGATQEEAIRKLQEAMFGFLQVAFSGESTKGLVLRPSPLSHRLHYYVSHVLPNLFHRRTKHLLLRTKDLEGRCLSH
jgi:predicted RNase H-like HicB family nuclease